MHINFYKGNSIPITPTDLSNIFSFFTKSTAVFATAVPVVMSILLVSFVKINVHLNFNPKLFTAVP